MIEKSHVELFAELVFERLAKHAASCDPIPPLAFGAAVEGASVRILGEAAIHQIEPSGIGRMVEGLLALPGNDLVAVVHETWAEGVPGFSRFGDMTEHLRWGADGRAEVVFCAIHGDGFQTGVLHAVDRSGGARSLAMGPVQLAETTFGGMTSRDMPTRH